jgi:hypothetical protein
MPWSRNEKTWIPDLEQRTRWLLLGRPQVFTNSRNFSLLPGLPGEHKKPESPTVALFLVIITIIFYCINVFERRCVSLFVDKHSLPPRSQSAPILPHRLYSNWRSPLRIYKHHKLCSTDKAIITIKSLHIEHDAVSGQVQRVQGL